MITLYGISNCDTVRKARRWLETEGMDYRFHDFRKDGLRREMITEWLGQIEWRDLLNTRGTTWRKLSAAEKAALDESAAIELMLKYPTIIKRPLLDCNGHYHSGFSIDSYRQICR